MTVVVALLAAAGAYLLFDGLTGRPRPSRAVNARIRVLLAEAGVRSVTPSGFCALCATCGVVALLVTAGITGSPVVAATIAAPATWAPVSFTSSRRRRRRERLRDAWPDAIVTLIASIRAGISLAESCASLADRGPEHLRPGFDAFRRSYRSRGSFTVGIDEMRRAMADPIADRVCVALSTAHEVGGSDLVRTLRALTDFLRDDLRIRREIHARWSWTVTAARVAAAAPWLVLIMMASRPEAARAYNSTAGVMVVLGGALATFIGYRLMLRAARLPEHRRLLG